MCSLEREGVVGTSRLTTLKRVKRIELMCEDVDALMIGSDVVQGEEVPVHRKTISLSRTPRKLKLGLTSKNRKSTQAGREPRPELPEHRGGRVGGQ